MISPEQHVEILAKDSERVSADIRQLESMVDKFIAFGVAVIGAGFAYGLQASPRVNEIFFVLPVALFGVYYVFFERMRTIVWLGAYKRALEDKINEISGTTVLKWEYLVQEHRGRADIIAVSVNVVYALILIGVVAYSWFKVRAIYSTEAFFGVRVDFVYTAVVIVLVLLLALCIRRWSTAYSPAYALSREMLTVSAKA